MMAINENINKNRNNINGKIFAYIMLAVFVLSVLYTLYFLYSLATGGSIIYDSIYPLLFFSTGTITFFGTLLIHQIMMKKEA
jgi:hypothetical protein